MRCALFRTVLNPTTPDPSSPEEGTTLDVRHCSGRHGGLPLPVGVTQSGWLTLNSPLDPQGRFQSEAGKELSTEALCACAGRQ